MADVVAGIVGGLGPESTIDYYRRILAAWALRRPGSAPRLVLDSLDVDRALRLVATDRAALVEYLLASVERLAAAGADFVAISANTPHIVFDELAARATVPLVSIVEACADAVQHAGLERVALLGTRFTMEAPFYGTVFARHAITVVSPPAEDRAWVHDRYVQQLLRGEFSEATREEFLALIRRLRGTEGIQGVILGGTELPLLLRAPSVDGLPFFDTTALHVEAIVARMADVALPESPLSSLRTFELTPATEPLLQRFFEANPLYFHAVQGEPAGPREAHEEITGLPPADMPYTKKWLIGYADEDGELAAMANVITDLLARHVWHIGLFLVATARHGSGDAQALYRGLEEWAVQHGAQWLRLGVVAGNTRAERFWESHGFVDVRTRDDVVMGKLTQTVRVMVKPLRGGSLDSYLALVPRDVPPAPADPA